ncbi:type II toxin-antitoxin system death-on-curing family toxin [Acetonema longum]|uniref:Fido domain-containing protein n=1 Tax=Acetonema longum DSM 6540 TaxID=1009370 RepID=F7NFC4_9FIRM|nr:type II toxin-antitoxin system death-on-curing family toxin [Acetonema longum]EGO65249.1 hypothetical protein ALO_03756 [Acetonema longum DSM 6540]
MRLLTVPDIILLHQKLIEQTGGSHGIRDISLIESAINRPLATFDGQDLYPSENAKIAAVTYSLVNNHAFVDGNKRVGVAAMLLLLRINGYRLPYTQQELVALGLSLANGSAAEKDILIWIENHKK